MAFFLSPLGGGDEWSEVEVRRRRQAHRETRASPRTQTSAQSSDARITTMLESTAIVCCCCCGGVRGAGEEEDVSPAAKTAVRCRKFAGARMVLLSLLRLVRVSCPWRFEHVGFYTLVDGQREWWKEQWAHRQVGWGPRGSVRSLYRVAP